MFQKKIRVFIFFFHNYFHHFEVVQKRYVYILGVCMIFFIMVDEGGIFFFVKVKQIFRHFVYL